MTTSDFTVPLNTHSKHRRVIRLAEREGAWQCHYCRHSILPVNCPCAEPFYRYDAEEQRWTRNPGYRNHHVDHIIPTAAGGANTIENCVLACAECNLAKGWRISYQEFKYLKDSEWFYNQVMHDE